ILLKAAGAVPVLRKRILTVSTPSLRLHSTNSATTPASLVSCTWSGSAGVAGGFGPPPGPAGRPRGRRAHILGGVVEQGARVEGDAARRRIAVRAHPGQLALPAPLALFAPLEAEARPAPHLDAQVLLAVVGIPRAGEVDLGLAFEGSVAGAAADAAGIATDVDAYASDGPPAPAAAAKRHALVAADGGAAAGVKTFLLPPLVFELALPQLVRIGADAERTDREFTGGAVAAFRLGLDVPGHPVAQVVEIGLPLFLEEQLEQGAQGGRALALNVFGFLGQISIHAAALTLEPEGLILQVEDCAVDDFAAVDVL